ncbi:MAG TPA: hypothetical protein VFT34_16420 [Verrucomicrobiae bacterium]|nr:hypothetical protein [Verrucomicrobiae bacterium]
MKPIPRQLAGLLLMCAGLAMTTLALAMLWLAPIVFVATARVLVPPPRPAPDHGTASTRIAGGAGWTPTELERIRAKIVLYQVITNLDLQRKRAEQFKEEGPLPMDKTYQLLTKQMEVRQSDNSLILEIRIQSYDRAEAATLANRVAEAYRDTRRADGAVVEIVESAQPPAKGRRSGGSSALVLFLAGLVGLGVGYWVLRSAGLLGPTPPGG